MRVFNLFFVYIFTGRFGFIDELQKMRPTSKSQPTSPSILFFANATWESLTKLGDVEVLITIQYLRTYLNAGRANIYLCGYKDEPFGKIESLWEYPLRRISIPQFFMKTFKPGDLDPSKCLALLRKYQPFSSDFPVNSGATKPVIWSENVPLPSIIIEHEVINRFYQGGFKEQSSRTYKQKVKIASIKMCYKD